MNELERWGRRGVLAACVVALGGCCVLPFGPRARVYDRPVYDMPAPRGSYDRHDDRRERPRRGP